MEQNQTPKKWYDNKVLVALLCIIFFPVGLYALWKNKEISRGWKIGVSILIGIVVISYAMRDGKHNTSTVDNDADKGNKEIQNQEIGNPDQLKFHSQFKIFKEQYGDASNDLKKSAIFRDLASYLRKYISNGHIQNWEGKLKSISTNEGGTKTHISIESDFNGMEITFCTWNNELSDMFDKTMIPLHSKVYKDLEKLGEGDNVIFSGNLLSDEKRGFKQQVITENGVVTDPELLLRFTEIKKK